ncbi:twp-component sensor histidine kinase [Bacteroides reticulotermitis JCM 10512]|uniref:histidine kinase n=2 Tax=Bacteroides reticulotermitis TaxID=1133319 RepID=W4V0V4_9BACE|nr:twp-component sensor histidine kinase [Bacteroides reticulotermitis JCM 10512]
MYISYQSLENKVANYQYFIMDEWEDWLLQVEENAKLPPEEQRVQKIDMEELRRLQQQRNDTLEKMDEEIGQLLTTQYAVTLIFIIAYLILVLQVVSKRLWKPFYQTLDTLEDFSIDKGVAPQFQKTNVSEFIRLNNSLEKMIKNSISIFQSQKEFTENASHELHTPLAIMQSQLDMLIQRPDLTEEQSEIISSIYSNVSHLARLNNNLLLLAKIDNRNQTAGELINVSQLVQDVLPNISMMIEDDELDFHSDIQDNCMLKANKVLFVSLLNNLLTNAIRYNQPQGCINLTLTDKEMIVANTGDNQHLDADTIFRRFYKNQEISKGHGLGLSIVEKICKYHGWKIEYMYEERHHIFTVTFGS